MQKDSAIKSDQHIDTSTRARLAAHQKAGQRKVGDTESLYKRFQKNECPCDFFTAGSIKWRMLVCQGLARLKRQRPQQIGKRIF